MCCLEGTDPTDIIAGKHVKKSKRYADLIHQSLHVNLVIYNLEAAAPVPTVVISLYRRLELC